MSIEDNHCLKRNLYENCCVRSKNGNILFYCSEKKAKWYINRNLAIVITNSPLEIQFNFEAKGNAHGDDPYYLQPLENICVVCGKNNNLTRHHIIPKSFRKHLADNIKNNSHHDVLLLCLDCHIKYENIAISFRRELIKEYDVPDQSVFNGEHKRLYKKYNIQHKCKSFARALLNSKNTIPDDRKLFLHSFIEENLNTDDIAAVLNLKIEDALPVRTCKLIIDKVENINDFMIRWREHFTKSMSPKFLPNNWSERKIIE